MDTVSLGYCFYLNRDRVFVKGYICVGIARGIVQVMLIIVIEFQKIDYC